MGLQLLVFMRTIIIYTEQKQRKVASQFRGGNELRRKFFYGKKLNPMEDS